MSEVLELVEDSFHENVIEADIPVLVDFWASWCGYCTKMLPVLNEIAEEMQGKINVFKVDIEKNRDLTKKYGVMHLPTMILFKDGEVVEKLTGYTPKDDIVNKILPQL